MRFKVEKISKTGKIPEVGKLWTHENQLSMESPVVFMRINDQHGLDALRLPPSAAGDLFFSAVLSGKGIGDIVRTYREDKDIVPLSDKVALTVEERNE